MSGLMEIHLSPEPTKNGDAQQAEIDHLREALRQCRNALFGRLVLEIGAEKAVQHRDVVAADGALQISADR